MRRNLDLYRGESLTFSGVLRNSSGAVDLTSATLTWRLGPSDGQRTNLTLTESNGITVTAGTGGQWSITLDPADTADLDVGYHQHQGKAVIGTTTYYFVTGRLRLRQDLPE
jgi:hypothetical protein